MNVVYGDGNHGDPPKFRTLEYPWSGEVAVIQGNPPSGRFELIEQGERMVVISKEEARLLSYVIDCSPDHCSVDCWSENCGFAKCDGKCRLKELEAQLYKQAQA